MVPFLFGPVIFGDCHGFVCFELEVDLTHHQENSKQLKRELKEAQERVNQPLGRWSRWSAGEIGPAADGKSWWKSFANVNKHEQTTSSNFEVFMMIIWV